MLPLIFILKAYSKAPMFRKKERFWDTEVRALKKRILILPIRGAYPHETKIKGLETERRYTFL